MHINNIGSSFTKALHGKENSIFYGNPLKGTARFRALELLLRRTVGMSHSGNYCLTKCTVGRIEFWGYLWGYIDLLF